MEAEKDVSVGNALSDRSNKLFVAAKKTHKTSNHYGLATVIAAVALFLLGVAGSFPGCASPSS
jgi:hypothetical protein